MRIHHLAFRTRDLIALERFYVRVLGFEVRARSGERSVWLALGEGSVLMLERAGEGEPLVAPGSKELVAFAIDAAAREEWVVRLAGAGVTLEAETPNTLYFRDPDGRRIALSHYPLAS